MKVTINANTNGKGKGTEEERLVAILKLSIGWSSLKFFPEDPFAGELRAFFDPSGFTPGSWNVSGHGYIRGDRLWLKEFKAGLREHGLSIKAAQNVSYNLAELQGENYVSLIIGPNFYKSWARLQKKLEKENAKLEATSCEV